MRRSGRALRGAPAAIHPSPREPARRSRRPRRAAWIPRRASTEQRSARARRPGPSAATRASATRPVLRPAERPGRGRLSPRRRPARPPPGRPPHRPDPLSKPRLAFGASRRRGRRRRRAVGAHGPEVPTPIPSRATDDGPCACSAAERGGGAEFLDPRSNAAAPREDRAGASRRGGPRACRTGLGCGRAGRRADRLAEPGGLQRGPGDRAILLLDDVGTGRSSRGRRRQMPFGTPAVARLRRAAHPRRGGCSPGAGDRPQEGDSA